MNVTDESIIPGKTEHFSFNMKKTIIDGSILYTIGEGPNFCLELVIKKPQEKTKTLLNNFHSRMTDYAFMKDLSNRAHLDKIEALYECIATEIDPEVLDKYSFGTEVLEFIIKYIKTHHPHIEEISLSDKSKIICDRSLNENMDLLTYSIALYGTSWYEQKFSAFYEKDYSNSKYKEQIDKLRSKKFKNEVLSDDVIMHLIHTYNPRALTVVKKEDIIKKFNDSNTLPEFMMLINADLDRSHKCRFYNSWLETLVRGVVKNIVTNWIIPIKNKNIKGGFKKRGPSRTQRLKSNIHYK
jgi:hypothetical protein